MARQVRAVGAAGALLLAMAGAAVAVDEAALARLRGQIASGDAPACAGCDLRGAQLSLADLGGADLAGADLGDADLSGARMTGADLSGARLVGANLIGTDLSGANLSGADLARAFIRATRLCATVMPDGHTDNSGC